MKYSIQYTGDTATKDACAIRDVQEYLGPRVYRETLGQYLAHALPHNATYSTKKRWVHHVRIVCGLAGIEGYPVRALCRAAIRQAAW